MHVVRMDDRGAAGRAVSLPTGAGQPDLPIPDHVHDAQPIRILDEVGRQAVPVGLVGTGRRDVLERARIGREVAGPALAVLTAGLLPEAVGVVGEPVGAGLLVGVQGARGDAAAAGRVVDRAGLLGPGPVGVTRRGGRQRRVGAEEAAGSATAADAAERELGLFLLLGQRRDLLLLFL